MCVLFIKQLLRLVGRLSTREPVKQHKLDGVITQNDRPKSIRNRRVIEVRHGVIVLSIVFLIGKRAFIIGLSQIFFFPPSTVVTNIIALRQYCRVEKSF